MQNTPKSLRLQMVFAGRVNAGKSSLVNLLSGQDTAIISDRRGTTTDVVEKAMELRPIGPVLLLDSAGTDDTSDLGKLRVERTLKAIHRADVMFLVTIPGVWQEEEKHLASVGEQCKIPVIPIINKCDTGEITPEFIAAVTDASGTVPITVNASDTSDTNRRNFIEAVVDRLLKKLPAEFFQSVPLLRDLLPPGGMVVMMTPIDTQAPKGRLILPQVQAIRDALDGDAVCVVAKENAFPEIYSRFSKQPDLVICDSQVVKKMIDTIPPGIPCTTFSILMARLKGDLPQLLKGAEVIQNLQPGDKILIAEACTHHAGTDDIGRVKIPALLQKKCNCQLDFEFFSGADFPEELSKYRLVVHCGGCMLNRQAMLNRLHQLANAGVPVVNYGVCISACTGVLEKVITPFRS